MNHLAAATNNHQTEVIMNQMTPFGNPDQTMSSLDFMEIVNRYRSEAGQTPHEPRKFLAKLEDELDDLTGKKFRLNNNQTKTAYYELNFDQMILVGMREAKIVRRNVLIKIKELENKQQSPQPKLPQNYLEALECLISTEKQRQAADDEARRLQVVCNTMAAQFSPGETAAQFCRQLNGVNTQQVQKWLAEQGWLIAVFGGGFQVSSKGRDGYFAEKHGDVEGRKTVKAVLTRKGAKWLYKQYLDGRLPMKATWDRKFTHCLFDGEVA